MFPARMAQLIAAACIAVAAGAGSAQDKSPGSHEVPTTPLFDRLDAHYYFARSTFAAGDIERSAEQFRRAAEVRLEDFQSPILLAQSLRMRPPALQGAPGEAEVARAPASRGERPG